MSEADGEIHPGAQSNGARRPAVHAVLFHAAAEHCRAQFVAGAGGALDRLNSEGPPPLGPLSAGDAGLQQCAHVGAREVRQLPDQRRQQGE